LAFAYVASQTTAPEGGLTDHPCCKLLITSSEYVIII